MKLSVSLTEDDVEYLAAYARERGLDSRSAAVQKAVWLLRASELGDAYEAAWSEWADSEDGDLWDAVSGDGDGDGDL